MSYSAGEWFSFIFFPIIAFVAFTTNVFIISAIKKLPSISRTYVLVLSQCLANAAFGISYLISLLVCSYRLLSMNSGPACDMFVLLRISCYYVSVFSMSAVAIDRFLVVHNYNRLRIRTWLSLALIWFAGFVNGTLTTVNMGMENYFTPTRVIGCRRALQSHLEFFSRKQLLIRFLIVTVFGDFLIVFATGALYFKVIWKLRARRVVGLDVTGSRQAEMQMRNRSMIKLLVSIFVTFAVLTAPYHILMVIRIARSQTTNQISTKSDICNADYAQRSSLVISLIFLMLTSCTNSFILFYFDHVVRSAMRNVKRRVSKSLSRRQEVSSGIATNTSYL